MEDALSLIRRTAMRDHRKSLRRATSPSHLSCELTLGSEALLALLLNESRDGFGVLVAGKPIIATNQRVYFHNYQGWFDCEIVYASEVLPKTTAIYKATGSHVEYTLSKGAWNSNDGISGITAYDIDKFTNQTQGPWFRLGLRSLHQIAAPSASDVPPTVENGGVRPKGWFKRLFSLFFGR
jgi:hypothetical protein